MSRNQNAETDPASARGSKAMRNTGSPSNANSSRWAWIFFVVLVGALILFGDQALESPQTISYSDFKQHLAQGAITEIVVDDVEIRGTIDTTGVEGEPIEGQSPPTEPFAFRTVRIEDPELVAALDESGVPYSGRVRSPWVEFLTAWLLPLGFMALVFFWLFRGAARRAGGQMMGFGKSRARLVPEEGTGIAFGDVAGCDEAKDELQQLVEFLRNPGRFTALGGRIPKGVLLLGPPGTGKTLLARAVAGEAGVPFFSLSGSDFVEMFVGVGAARVRDLFEQAKAAAPCIVFVDEVDAIGRQRGISMGVVNDEREQTLNQLLAEMDGFENNAGVILLAATNRPEVLDKALLRPGRFDRQVVLDSPDLAGRTAILRVHVRGKPLATDTDLEHIARLTPGMSGADLANIVNEAALIAADRGADAIEQADLLSAVEKVIAGPERRSRRLEPEEKRRVAYHEAGHALVAARVAHADPVQKITIVPRGRAALGYTMQLPDQERYLQTADELSDRLAITMGGRAAEQLVFPDVSTGARDDLRIATDIARRMVCLFGMNEQIGLAHCARPTEGAYLPGDGSMSLDCSEDTARQVDEEVRKALDQALDRARSILDSERELLDTIASELLERETLDRSRFEQLVG